MSNAVYFVSYKLKKGASVPDFLLAAETLCKDYMSKQKGFISWKQVVDGETWADILTVETMEDAKRISTPTEPNPLAEAFYAYINLNSCRAHLFSVERSY